MRRANPKGTGAFYGPEITQLSPMHVRVLKILANGPGTKQEVTKQLNEEAERSGTPLTGGFSISGRLSELLGAGCVEMQYSKVQVWNAKTMQFRFVKKPLWSITQKGRTVLREGGDP